MEQKSGEFEKIFNFSRSSCRSFVLITVGPAKAGETRRPRNYALGGGIMRFSQSRMYKKRAIYRKRKPGQKPKTDKTLTPARMITKPIGGDKNGGQRTVRINRQPRYYPTEDKARKLKSHKKAFSQHRRRLRSSITPGTVLILLAGRHKGKRVVFLKQLESGLLLVTGPYHLNGCPLRRINQIYTIATKTKLDISKLNMPERVNDKYFKRVKLQRAKKAEGEFFETKKERYSVSDERKEDQVSVDRQVLDVIRQNPDKKYLFGYLGAMFSLRGRQFPHKMVF